MAAGLFRRMPHAVRPNTRPPSVTIRPSTLAVPAWKILVLGFAFLGGLAILAEPQESQSGGLESRRQNSGDILRAGLPINLYQHAAASPYSVLNVLYH